MKYPKILVTGATGKTGRAVVEELLAKEVPVRALVHSRDARSAALARGGAEIVVAATGHAEKPLGLGIIRFEIRIRHGPVPLGTRKPIAVALAGMKIVLAGTH